MGESLSSLTAKNLGLEKSLLERLFEYYPFDVDCKLKLLENFRSYNEIVNLTSHLFYQDSLISNKIRDGIPFLREIIYYFSNDSNDSNSQYLGL